jgi:hypothetical protein
VRLNLHASFGFFLEDNMTIPQPLTVVGWGTRNSQYSLGQRGRDCQCIVLRLPGTGRQQSSDLVEPLGAFCGCRILASLDFLMQRPRGGGLQRRALGEKRFDHASQRRRPLSH